jgi:IS5 family transposase
VLAIRGALLHTEAVQGKSDPNPELLDAGALCRQLVPDGSVHAFLADHRAELFPEEAFADLFPSGTGRPSVPAEIMAAAMVLKELEGHSDRQAADALRCDIRWKVATGLPLDHPGVHFTVFTYWRSRLDRSARPERIREAVAEVIEATGVLAGRRRRALDSTLLDDAVATQDTVTQLVSAIRRVRRLVPEAATVSLSAHDYDAAGKPVCAWDDPQAKAALVSALVNDARAIIVALDGVELSGQQADAVGLLALVAGQDVEPGEEEGTWRIAQRVAPERVISTVDPEARHMHKSRSEYRDGYKAHLAVEPETGLITAAALTPANAADGPNGVALLAGENPGLEVLADSAYGSGQTRTDLRAGGHTQTIKPIPLRAAVPGGFTKDDFAIDLAAGTVTCPAGQTVSITRTAKATFGTRCRTCPLVSRCTTSKTGRLLQLHPHEEELIAARRRAEEPEFATSYRQWRPMVERSIAWLVADGHRRVRYRGVRRNQLGLSLRVAAVNLRRLVNLGLDHDGTWVLAV